MRPTRYYWTGERGSPFNNGEMTGVSATWNAGVDKFFGSREIEARDWVLHDVPTDVDTFAGRPVINVGAVAISYAISAPRERVGWNTTITISQGVDNYTTIFSMANIDPDTWVEGDRWRPDDFPDQNLPYYEERGTQADYREQPEWIPENLNGVLLYSGDDGGIVTFYSHFLTPVVVDLSQPFPLDWVAASFNGWDEYDFYNAYRQTDVDHAPAYTGGSSERIVRISLVEFAAPVDLPNLTARPWVPRRRFGTTDEE